MSFLDQNKSTSEKEQPVRVYLKKYIDFELQFDNVFSLSFSGGSYFEVASSVTPKCGCPYFGFQLFICYICDFGDVRFDLEAS